MEKAGKNFVKILCIAASLAVGLALFCGCGKAEKQSLEEMVTQNPEMAKEIEKGLGDIDTEGVSPSLSYEKNTIVISLKYDKTYDEDDIEVLSGAFDENGEIFDAKCEEAIANIKSSTELKKVSIEIVVLNGDGAELWSKAYGK